ncbi:MAG: hypothetical protein ACKODX_14080, partial [Gemmata sp.]
RIEFVGFALFGLANDLWSDKTREERPRTPLKVSRSRAARIGGRDAGGGFLFTSARISAFAAHLVCLLPACRSGFHRLGTHRRISHNAATQLVRPNRPHVPGLNLLGASLGACIGVVLPAALLALVFALNPFKSDGEWRWVLPGAVPFAGAVGALTDIPLSIWRRRRQQQPRPRSGIEVLALSLVATFLLCLAFVAAYEALRPRSQS